MKQVVVLSVYDSMRKIMGFWRAVRFSAGMETMAWTLGGGGANNPNPGPPIRMRVQRSGARAFLTGMLDPHVTAPSL